MPFCVLPDCNHMTTRQSRRRARIIEAGGSQLSTLLDRRATLCLQEIKARTGETTEKVIARLLWLGADPSSDHSSGSGSATLGGH